LFKKTAPFHRASC